MTGMKFLLVSSGVDRIKEQEVILKSLYEVYADYVGKNPFQEADMPIKSELFDNGVMQLFT